MFSFIFALWLVVPIVIVGSWPSSVISPSTSILVFAFNFSTPRDPVLPIYWLISLLVLGGAVGVSILIRWRFAYHFSIAYCTVAFVSIISIHICFPDGSKNWINGVPQYLLLLWFFQHVVRRRVAWHEQMSRR